jgi:hypothetical protein
LTNKSTDYIIQTLEAGSEPKLFRFRPDYVGTERERRMLSIAPSIHDWLYRSVRGDASIQLKAAVKEHFGRFVKGELIDDCDYMKRVCDYRQGLDDFSADIWSVRPSFRPKHRFFGAFFREDWFVIFTKRKRDYLDDHEDRWHAEIDAVRTAWDRLFFPRPRHSGHALTDYLTFNAEHCDDRW